MTAFPCTTGGVAATVSGRGLALWGRGGGRRGEGGGGVQGVGLTLPEVGLGTVDQARWAGWP